MNRRDNTKASGQKMATLLLFVSEFCNSYAQSLLRDIGSVL